MCGGAAPLAVEGKALGSPRGALGSTAPSGVPSPAEPAILRSSTSSILSGSLYPPSLLYSATLLGMPPPQALIYSLTASPPSGSSIILLPFYLTSPTVPSTSPTVLTPTRYPSRFTSLRLYPPTSLALWPQKHTSTHTPSFLSSSVVAYFAYFLCSLC